MDNIEQKIIKLYEDGINYQIINNEKNKYEYIEKNIIKNHNEFISLIKKRNGISIITGNNGIGKTYLLKLINDKFIEESKKTKLIELKKYTSLNEIENEILKQHEIIIFDGLDEINMSIVDDVINYIFSISNKKVIVSSRKDFLQKNNMLNVIYNVYEIMPIEEYKVKKIIEELDIEGLKTDNIMNLLKIPRFLLYIIENIEKVKNLKRIDKYSLLSLIIENHLDTLNNRANTKIEKHIHRKILQSTALVMMMAGKTNLTIEEFITFISRINYLDIKSYILNENIIESFLNNQLILNDGKILQFENKELMEFLAAKEIIENDITNEDGILQININNKADNNNMISWNKDVYDTLVVTYIYSEDVKTSSLEITTNSEIKPYNSEKTYKGECVVRGTQELNNIIMTEEKFDTDEIYKGQLYANINATEKKDIQYDVVTKLIVTNADVVDEIVISEGPDVFETSDSELTANTKYIKTEINKEKMLEILGTDGKIEIKNGSKTTLINQDTEVDENGNIVINYETVGTTLDITTSKPEIDGILEIKHTKAITENTYTRKQLQLVKTIKAKNSVEGTITVDEEKENVITNSTEASFELKETISKAELTVDRESLSTTQENEVTLGIKLITDGVKYDLFKNPTIKIQLPASVEKVRLIEKPSKLYADEFEIHANYNSTNKIIQIKLEGEQTIYPTSELTQAYYNLT